MIKKTIYAIVMLGILIVVGVIGQKFFILSLPKGRLPDLHQASGRGELDTVKNLIRQGANVNSKDHYSSSTPLHVAAVNGAVSVVEFLLSQNAEVNARDQDYYTPLHFAADNEQQKIVDVLIAYGADVNVQSKYGTTPLHCALKMDSLSCVNSSSSMYMMKRKEFPTYQGPRSERSSTSDVVRLLLNAGASPNISDTSGNTPLHEAALEGYVTSMKLLLSKKADVNAYNSDHCTPLYYAAIRGHKSAVELLIANGADVNIPSDDGETPLDAARRTNRKNIIKLLTEYTITDDKQE